MSRNYDEDDDNEPVEEPHRTRLEYFRELGEGALVWAKAVATVIRLLV